MEHWAGDRSDSRRVVPRSRASGGRNSGAAALVGRSGWTEHLRSAQGAPTGSSAAAAAGSYVAGSEYGGRAQFGSTPEPPAEPAQQQVPPPAQQQQYGQQQHGGQQEPRSGSRSPYTEPSMAVSQKRKLIELTNEYDIYGRDGAVIGTVVEVNQSGLKKAARFLTSLDQFMTHTLEVRDSAGQVLMVLTRPAKIMKSTLVVSHPNGSELGRLVQRNMFGKIRFGMEAGGAEVGSLNAQNWIAWNFQLQDSTGREIGRITKTFEGFLTTMFTTADKYSVELDPTLTEPLKSLAIAAALCVDTALKQDSRGFG